jgi:hypothetical protein
MKYQYLDQQGKETCMENKKLHNCAKFCEGKEEAKLIVTNRLKF